MGCGVGVREEGRGFGVGGRCWKDGTAALGCRGRDGDSGGESEGTEQATEV